MNLNQILGAVNIYCENMGFAAIVIMNIGWRKAKKLFAAPLCGAAKQHGCFAVYSLQ